MPVFFHSEETDFLLKNKNLYKKWVKFVVESRDKKCGSINFVFTSNEYILEINRNYLNHNYFTDVITFSYNEGKVIAGDIFISIEQVKINSSEIGILFYDELKRVMIHGVLHLLGIMDATDEERRGMRLAEDEAISLLKGMIDENDV